MPLSGRFGQIGYHYKLHDIAKMCAPVLKCHQLQGGETLPPGPPLGVLSQTPVTRSRYRARHSTPSFCSRQLQTILPAPLEFKT